jgi:GGDEF domain-containing protein
VTLLLLGAVLLVAGMVVRHALASPSSDLRPSPPEPSIPAQPAARRTAESGARSAADGSLAVVAVAVDQMAAATRQLGDAFAAEARAEVAGALRAAVRRQDLCTPWRNQMVIAVLPGVDLSQTAALRQRVQRALSELRIVTHAGDEMSIGFRVASACAPADGTSEADLLDAAEKRLAEGRPRAIAPADDASARLCAALPILTN